MNLRVFSFCRRRAASFGTQILSSRLSLSPSVVFLFPRLMLFLRASPSPDCHFSPNLGRHVSVCGCAKEGHGHEGVVRVLRSATMRAFNLSLSSQRRPSCSSNPLPPPSLSSSSSSCSSLIEPDTGGREHPVRLLTRKSSMGQPSRGCDRPERVRDLARSAPPTKPSVDSNRLDAYRALAWTLRRSTDVLGNDPSTFSTLLRLA